MKNVKQFLCLVMAVVLSVSCTDNTKMQNLLENIPENTDFVFVGSVKTVLESAGGKIENSKIVLPNYISNEMKEGDAEKFDEANNFLKDAGIDIEACAVMMSFRNFSPILVFALEDQQKFVDVLKQQGYQKDSDKGDAVFYMKPSESSYGSPNYVALNGSFAYVIMENYLRSDFNAISYLERVIEDAAEANYADTPSGEYILGTNGGGLATKLPAKLKNEMREEGLLNAEANVLLNAVYCVRGELTSNKATVECKVFPEDGDEFDTEKLAKLFDIKSEVSDEALKLLGSQENIVMAMSMKDANWDEVSNLIATTSHLSRSEKAQMNAVFSYLEKINGTVAIGLGVTNGIESFIKIDKEQEVLNQFSATIVIETKEGKAKLLIEDMKGMLEQLRLPFNEDATGFSINLDNMGGTVYVKQVDNFIVVANHAINKDNDNPVVKRADFSNCIAAFYMGLNSNDKLAKDLGVKDNITIGICCKPKDGKAYMSLEIDGSSDSGVIEKVARLLLNSQKKVEQRMREAYAQEGVVEEAAYLEPDDYDNFE